MLEILVLLFMILLILFTGAVTYENRIRDTKIQVLEAEIRLVKARLRNKGD